MSSIMSFFDLIWQKNIENKIWVMRKNEISNAIFDRKNNSKNRSFSNLKAFYN